MTALNQPLSRSQVLHLLEIGLDRPRAKERGIIFKAEMVRAILDGRKTQTRRIIKPPPVENCFGNISWQNAKGEGCSNFRPDMLVDAEFCPFGVVGDQLWVREGFFIDHYEYYPSGPLPKEKPELSDGQLLYRADGTCCEQLGECECEGKGAKWRSPLFMPRWASRITLEIIGVRVERVQEITTAGARSEGFPYDGPQPEGARIRWFTDLWDSINGKGAWAANPWVWVIEFRRCK